MNLRSTLSLSHTASRAKLSMLNTMSKIRGQVKNPGYPQAEGLLGECMGKYGRELGEDTNFGEECLCVFGFCTVNYWRKNLDRCNYRVFGCLWFSEY